MPTSTIALGYSHHTPTMHQQLASPPLTPQSTQFTHRSSRSVSSFDSRFSDEEDDISSRPSLHQILLNQGRGRYTLDNFAAFLHNQFCYENLAFWLASRQYKLCAQSLYLSVSQSCPEFTLHQNSTERLTPSQSRQFSDLQRKMRAILDTFVLPSSPHELNLSDAVRCRLLRIVAEGNYHPQVLEQARESIMDLMKCSSYPMFLEDIQQKRMSSTASQHSLPESESHHTSSSASSNSDTDSSSWKLKAKQHLKVVSRMLKKRSP